ncbi:cupin domain-containing protein [Runella sp.]|uniref:cupin domain-containing protein n=1 Tax=Runella sp. TaxID=1960881 RepID=UPI003D0A460C
MKIQAYIESGIIEEFCLGLLSEEQAKEVTKMALLFPEIQREIVKTEEALANYAETSLNDDLKGKIIGVLRDLQSEEEIKLENPPFIHRYSDAAKWNAALTGIEPTIEYNGLKVHFLRKSKEVQLCLAWLKSDLVEDAHHRDDFQESFLILEGACECKLGNKAISLQPGDYVDIPFDTPHTIKVVTPSNGFLKALIQRKKTVA